MLKDFEFVKDILTGKHKAPDNTGTPTGAADTAPAAEQSPASEAPIEATPTAAAGAKPADAAPVNATPDDTAPADAAPSEDTAPEQASAEPTPTAAAPAEVAPSESTPTGAAPAEVAPSEPTPTGATGAPTGEKSKAKPIAITAAIIGVVVIIGIIVAIIANANPLKAVELPGNLTLRRFESRDQLTGELARLQKLNNQDAQKVYNDTVGKVAAESGLDENGDLQKALPNLAGVADEIVEGFSETFQQLAGVDDSDPVKTDGKYIYCIDSDYIDRDVVEIFKADGNSAEKAARIEFFGEEADAATKTATADEAEGWNYYAAYRSIDDIYVKDNRLIVIGSDSTPHNGSTATRNIVKVYDVSDIEHITLLDTYTQSGAGKATHMIGDTLYLASTYTPFDVTYLPCGGRGDNPEELPVENIYTLQDNKTERFLVISAFDTLDHKAQAQSMAILGEAKDFYCKDHNLYIYAGFGEKKKQSGLLSFLIPETAEKSQILKLDIENGVNLVAYTDLDGVIGDAYCLDEYDGNLRVTTTVANGTDETDHLYVLDGELNTIGSLRNFAKGEYLAAIRYVGNTAYVVAYNLVEPLYTIDLSDPKAPVLMGAAGLSGFAAMVEPIGDNMMLGLGYESMGVGDLMSEDAVKDGFKLVLFDTTNPSNPMIFDAAVYENCTSAVQNNPNALVYNSDRGDYIVPLNEEYWGEIDTEKGEYVESEDNRGGVLDFKVEKGKIKEVKRYETDHKSIERCTYVGDNIYMIYRDKDDAIQIDTVKYAN